MVNTTHVVLVDDDLDFCLGMKFLFETINHVEFTAYQNPHQFLSQHTHWTNGFLLLDVLISGMDGIRLLQQIIKQNKLYTIMISGHADQAIAKQALALGADDFLLKPFDIVELLKKLKLSELQP